MKVSYREGQARRASNLARVIEGSVQALVMTEPALMSCVWTKLVEACVVHRLVLPRLATRLSVALLQSVQVRRVGASFVLQMRCPHFRVIRAMVHPGRLRVSPQRMAGTVSVQIARRCRNAHVVCLVQTVEHAGRVRWSGSGTITNPDRSARAVLIPPLTRS